MTISPSDMIAVDAMAPISITATDLFPCLRPGRNFLNSTTAMSAALAFAPLMSDLIGNISIGAFAGGIVPTAGQPNTSIGQNALADNQSGSANVAVGDQAGQHNTTGISNCFIGHRAGLWSKTQSANTFIGDFCGVGSSIDPLRVLVAQGLGGANVGVGEACMLNALGYTDGCAGFGFNALFSGLYLSSCSAVGIGAMSGLLHAKHSAGFGANSGRFMTGDYTTAIGDFAGAGLATYNVFTGAAALGATVIPFTDTSWAAVNGAVSAGAFVQSQCTISGKTSTTVTITNNANTASVLGNFALVNTRTGQTLYPTAFVMNGSAKWYYADTSGFLAGDTVTSGALVGGTATVSTIVANVSISLSALTNVGVTLGTQFIDRTTGYIAMPSAITGALSNVYTFANGTAWATAGDIISVPGAVYDGTTILAINPNVSVTLSQPLIQAIVPNGVTGIYFIANPCTGLGNTFLGYAAGINIAGAATQNLIAGYAAAATLSTGTFNIIIGGDVHDGTASNQTVIGHSQVAAYISGSLYSKQGLPVLNNAAGVTLTTAQIAPGVLTRSGAAAVADTTPSAALIVAAIPGAEIGSGYEFSVINSNSGTLTLTAGAGVTLAGTTTIAAGQMRRYLARVSAFAAGTEAVTFQGVFTCAP